MAGVPEKRNRKIRKCAPPHDYKYLAKNYDSLDRVIKTTLPSDPLANPVTQLTRYEIRGNHSLTITTDPKGNISEQEADGRGNIIRVRRIGKEGNKELTRASYKYNGLGEMLVARDADGNPLTAEYDMLGRRTKLASADIGVKQWWYDTSGNVVMESDSELERQGKRIRYEYDGMNRLLKINYPFSAATVYEYGEYQTGGRDDNAVGRVTKVTDETGSISYQYGLLGQVEEETRVIKLLPLSGGRTKTATTGYLSDYLGRMQEIRYPDGETVSYTYGYGGQITGVTGVRKNTEFPYVKMIGYDEYSQRVYVEYGSGIKTRYEYDPYRRWLKHIKTESPSGGINFQDMEYTFDEVGNVKKYENNAWGHTTSQEYGYDGLYQLTSVNGSSRSHPWAPTGSTEYTTNYTQTFDFSTIGNMTSKISTESVSNTNRIGTDLNYSLDYAYYPGTHKAERIGTRYYDYDGNGNLIAEREGGHAVNANVYRPYHQDGSLYWTEYGFGLVRPEGNTRDDGTYQRNYKWNERNLLSESSDISYTVQYRYGADGQRALKFTANSGRTTAYFNKMWQTSDISADWLQSKHIYVGEDRIATKYNSEGNENTQAEKERTYYYHSDHLGSAQTVTNWRGQVHERLEYTPYGELWIDWKSADAPEDKTPFRFTGKEPDPETGLYYYGARYLDPKTSRWISGDPALGDYLPVAPLGDEEKKRNSNLPGQGGIFNTVNMHVYHYAGNNPVKYVDPDGRDIYIPSEKDRKRIRDMINSVSLYKYEVDKDGHLYRLGNSKNFNFPFISKKSQAFSDQLEGGINSDRLITIKIDDFIKKDDGTVVDVQKIHDGGVTGKKEEYGIRSSAVTITGKPTSKRVPLKNGGTTSDSAEKTLVHELTVHAIPYVNNNDESLNNENAVRREMKWPERGLDEQHHY